MLIKELFGWIKPQIHPNNSSDRKAVHRSVTESLSQADELNRLKRLAESVQSQLDGINTRIHQVEKPSGFLSAHINEAFCTGCGRCVPICPRGAIALTNHSARVDRDKCTGCGICLPECPVGAVELVK